jgi:hypothetical protein
MVMKTRRQFLTQATVTLLLVPLTECASSSPPAASTGDDGGASPDAAACDGVHTTSSNVSEHTHTLCVPQSDLSSPPGQGATYTSSSSLDPLNDENHTHTITLSAQQLLSIETGAQVVVTSSVSDSHTHQFAIVRSRT